MPSPDADADSPRAPAGWYPDPEGFGQQRYWDGSRWTNRYTLVEQRTAGATGGTTLGEFFVLEKWWVRWLVGLAAAVAVWGFLISWGVGGWTPTVVSFVVGTAITWSLDTKFDNQGPR